MVMCMAGGSRLAPRDTVVARQRLWLGTPAEYSGAQRLKLRAPSGSSGNPILRAITRPDIRAMSGGPGLFSQAAASGLPGLSVSGGKSYGKGSGKFGFSVEEQPLTALGLLQEFGHSAEFQFLRLHRKQRITELLTIQWPVIQGRSDELAIDLWQEAVELLELDSCAITDLLLLVHQGLPGRSEANEIMWTLLHDFGLSSDLRDLSRKASKMIREARRWIDRPPANSRDQGFWHWRHVVEPRNPRWSPASVPAVPVVLTKPDGSPLPPPQCWKPPSPPRDPAPRGPPQQAPAAVPSGPPGQVPGSSNAPQWPSGGGRPAFWRRG